MVLKRVGVWSAARVAAAIYGGLGLIIGSILALASLVGAGFAAAAFDQDSPPAFLGVIFGVGAVIFVPILYGLFGAIGAAISSALYNLVARTVGGVELELD